MLSTSDIKIYCSCTGINSMWPYILHLWPLISHKNIPDNIKWTKQHLNNHYPLLFLWWTVSLSFCTECKHPCLLKQSSVRADKALFQSGKSNGTKHHMWFVLSNSYQTGGATGYRKLRAGKYTNLTCTYRQIEPFTLVTSTVNPTHRSLEHTNHKSRANICK